MIKKLFKSESLSIGLAMFSMFFGAGNIIFPLVVGQYAGDKNLYAILGLILTATVMPILGVVAMILFDGNYRNFFGRLGRIPGFIIALITISLLGPLGSTPRCIALSYTTLTSCFSNLSPTLFSAIACIIVFLFTFRKNHILTILGWVLTPVLLCSLIAIILIGLIHVPSLESIDQSNLSTFLYGLKEGYNTMDLLAAFFFSSTVIQILKSRFQEKITQDSKRHISIAFRASIICAVLLGAIYIGFSYLAAFHGHHLNLKGDELLSAITMHIIGSHAGPLVCIAIALACLTTAIALITAFADFFQKEVFKEKVSYKWILVSALIITFFVSTFEFKGISAFLGPILQICYPGLIILTILNIAHRLKNFQPIKVPVFFAFGISSAFYFL